MAIFIFWIIELLGSSSFITFDKSWLYWFNRLDFSCFFISIVLQLWGVNNSKFSSHSICSFLSLVTLKFGLLYIGVSPLGWIKETFPGNESAFSKGLFVDLSLFYLNPLHDIARKQNASDLGGSSRKRKELPDSSRYLYTSIFTWSCLMTIDIYPNKVN